MSRTGWSTSNFLRASAVATATPLSMAAWGRTDVLATYQTMVGCFNSSTPQNRQTLQLLLNLSDGVRAFAASGSSTASADSSGSISSNTWFHGCAVFASATSRAAYLNGANKGTNTTNMTPSGIDRTSIGVGDGSSAALPFAPAGTGYLAEVGIWNVALTDAEVAVLATGVSPLQVRPASLIAYWPLVGNNSPETNVVSTTTQAVQGALSAAEHPRIIMPQRQNQIII